MPTAKPRLQITLDPDDYKFFKQFAELQGLPAASLISKYLHEAVPMFRQLAGVLQEIKRTDFSQMTDSQREALITVLKQGDESGMSALAMIGETAQRVEAALPRRTREPKSRHSLIHTNKSPKSSPTRLPAGKVQQKRGGKRAST